MGVGSIFPSVYQSNPGFTCIYSIAARYSYTVTWGVSMGW